LTTYLHHLQDARENATRMDGWMRLGRRERSFCMKGGEANAVKLETSGHGGLGRQAAAPLFAVPLEEILLSRILL
jgi:hypothetical protein